MFDCVLTNVIEPGQIRTLVSQPAVPEIEPDLAPGCVVEPVQLTSRVSVEMLEEFSQVRGAWLISCDKMIVIGEDSSGF